jgi:quinoprotein glucose dehydrogenase
MILRRHLIPLSLIAISVGAALVSCSRNGTNPTPLQPVALSGPASYTKNCVGCHGPKGEGVKDVGVPLLKLGVRIPHDDQIRHIIRNGRGKMPGYQQMSDAELDALIAYIKTL